jgi:hypothetical protein
MMRGALEDEKREAPALRAFYFAVVAFVRVAYEGAPEILANFGLSPKKVKKPLSGEQQAAAAAKRAATRAARGTIGKRKKAGIKGSVTGVVVTPVTATPAAGSTPTGGASGTSAGNGATPVANGVAVNGSAAGHLTAAGARQSAGAWLPCGWVSLARTRASSHCPQKT